jgi:TRAP-type mannitol/chloroaromatic compound transport system permease small subunit
MIGQIFLPDYILHNIPKGTPTRENHHMQAALGLSRLIDGITTAIGKSVIWLIFAAILISAINAVTRKLWSLSSNSWLEAQWYLFGAAFMLGAAYTLKENEHIRIDIFYGSRSRRLQHWIDLFGHVVFLLPFVTLTAWMLWPYWIDAYQSGQVSTNAGGLLIWPARAILFAGFALLTLQAVSEIIKKIAIMRDLIPDTNPFISPAEQAAQAVQEMTGSAEVRK